MDLSENIVLLVTHSFEVSHTNQTSQEENIVLKKGEIYPLLHSDVSLFSNSDGSYTGTPSYLIRYNKNGTYIPVHIKACSGIKVIDQNEFDIDKYFNYEQFDATQNIYDILSTAPAIEQEFTFDGKTVKASTNFLRVKSSSLFPLDTPIIITDGAWHTSMHTINISFSFYILNSNEIRILFEANASREYWDGDVPYDDYIEKMKEIIEEYPYLVIDHFQDSKARTHFLFSYPYKTKTTDEPLEHVINWAYDIVSDIRNFTDKRIMLLLQEQE